MYFAVRSTAAFAVITPPAATRRFPRAAIETGPWKFTFPPNEIGLPVMNFAPRSSESKPPSANCFTAKEPLPGSTAPLRLRMATPILGFGLVAAIARVSCVTVRFVSALVRPSVSA